MRTMVIGDIHGRYGALMQCLHRSGFDHDEDKLICLGDVADRGFEVPQCMEELLKIKHLIYILGNHDKWLREWMVNGDTPYVWLAQGGHMTMEAYQRVPELIPRHKEFLTGSAKLFHLEGQCLFVHAGIDWNKSLEEQDEDIFLWDRRLFEAAFLYEKKKKLFPVYKEIYIGHTPTIRIKDPKIDGTKPLKRSNVWMLDQGAAYGGRLTLMDIHTKEYWQSDTTRVL